MNNMQLPIPTLSSIIPRMMSTWNTISHLLDLIGFRVPNTNSKTEAQPEVIRRLLLIAATVAFRLVQIVKAKQPMKSQYDCLFSFQKCASRRLTFKKMLEKMAHYLCSVTLRESEDGVNNDSDEEILRHVSSTSQNRKTTRCTARFGTVRWECTLRSNPAEECPTALRGRLLESEYYF
jgi:hypothetical protein